MIQIVTDSSANLPPDQLTKHHFEIVPLKAIFGTKEYRDGVDLSNQEFYEMLPKAKEHPTTSQPSAAGMAPRMAVNPASRATSAR